MSKARCAGGSRPGRHARVRGVAVRDPFRGRYELSSRVVVDASGHTGFLARESGLRPGNDRSAVGMELELHAPAYDQDEVVFWLGDDVAPGGYGWAFPCGDGRVRLGVGVVRPDSDAEPRVLLERLREEFVRLVGPGSRRRAAGDAQRPDAGAARPTPPRWSATASSSPATLPARARRCSARASATRSSPVAAPARRSSTPAATTAREGWRRTRRNGSEQSGRNLQDLLRRQRADLRLRRRRLGSRHPSDGQADAAAGGGGLRELVQRRGGRCRCSGPTRRWCARSRVRRC